ncbi:MAG: hypothetical protein ABJK39_00905, partial [Hyphomicrobiales bacterium]
FAAPFADLVDFAIVMLSLWSQIVGFDFVHLYRRIQILSAPVMRNFNFINIAKTAFLQSVERDCLGFTKS